MRVTEIDSLCILLFFGLYLGDRNVSLVVLLVSEDCMAVTECPPLDILTTQSHSIALVEQRGKGQGL